MCQSTCRIYEIVQPSEATVISHHRKVVPFEISKLSGGPYYGLNLGDHYPQTKVSGVSLDAKWYIGVRVRQDRGCDQGCFWSLECLFLLISPRASVIFIRTGFNIIILLGLPFLDPRKDRSRTVLPSIALAWMIHYPLLLPALC